MPTKMTHLLDMLGVANEDRMYRNTLLGSDSKYGMPMTELGKGHSGVLFPPLRSDC